VSLTERLRVIQRLLQLINRLLNRYPLLERGLWGLVGLWPVWPIVASRGGLSLENLHFQLDPSGPWDLSARAVMALGLFIVAMFSFVAGVGFAADFKPRVGSLDGDYHRASFSSELTPLVRILLIAVMSLLGVLISGAFDFIENWSPTRSQRGVIGITAVWMAYFLHSGLSNYVAPYIPEGKRRTISGFLAFIGIALSIAFSSIRPLNYIEHRTAFDESISAYLNDGSRLRAEKVIASARAAVRDSVGLDRQDAIGALLAQYQDCMPEATLFVWKLTGLPKYSLIPLLEQARRPNQPGRLDSTKQCVEQMRSSGLAEQALRLAVLVRELCAMRLINCSG
jgi:hypothetical protein